MNIAKVNEAVDYLRKKGFENLETGIILGTGLGKLVNEITDKKIIEYKEIPNFSISTVESHKGNLIQGELQGKKVLVFQGRFHFYEGYTMNEIVFPVRVMSQLGVSKLLIFNAAGAINLDFKKGTLMLIEDHIDLFPQHPLRGKNIPEWGTRFPDMSAAYDLELNQLMLKSAMDLGISLNKGTYISAMGPMLETAAEYRMLRKSGGDAVGMSTIPEVIAARHMGMKCCAVSVLTDECDPDYLKEIDISEIIQIASETEMLLIKLIKASFLSKLI